MVVPRRRHFASEAGLAQVLEVSEYVRGDRRVFTEMVAILRSMVAAILPDPTFPRLVSGFSPMHNLNIKRNFR